MGNFNLRTFFFLVTYLAFMGASYRFLPEFARLRNPYPNWVLSGCWGLAAIGAFVPVFIKQRFLSNRFWYVLVTITMIGTWSGFWLLYFWCANEARRSSQFPGLGAVLFLAIASIVSGFISFVLGWFIPKHPAYRKSEYR